MGKFNYFVENFSTILNIVLFVISIFLAIISTVFKIKSNFTACISQFIKDAEADSELTNTEKMDMVISWIKDSIPRMFKILFSDKVLSMMAENIYNDMKTYREIYINNKTGLSTSRVIQIVKELEEEKEDPEYKEN